MIGVTLAQTTFTAPHLSYSGLSPMLVIWSAATLGVGVEAVVPRAYRWLTQVSLAFAGLVGALIAVIMLAGTAETVAVNTIAVDGPALFLEGTLLALAIASLLFVAERSVDTGGGAFVQQASVLPGSSDERRMLATERQQTEVYPLVMFSVGGMLMFASSNNLLAMFVALEVLSLPLYLLCGLARRRRLLSQEAAVKYFLLGSFSSAFFLYGLAMIYGYAGSLDLDAVRNKVQVATSSDVLLYIGIALLGVGLLFKVSAAPFHTWTPDVYQGAPTPITAFMAAGTKVAAFGALLRVFYVAFEPAQWDWRPLMWGVAILTMVVGSVLALTQTDIKRMLAYSSIAHAGFLITGVLAVNRDGLAGTMFYLVTYGFATVAAFAIVSLVRDPYGEATHLSQWRGLGRRSPVLAVSFTFLLLAFAGIPLTSGFMAKFAVFKAAIDGGAVPVVVVALVMSAVAAFFYLRVVVLMFWQEPAEEGPTIAVPSMFTASAIALGLAVTVVLGIVPGPVLDLAHRAAVFVP
ncbi:MAG: NADH-quinone oxidoreductase subunit NuoN [Frankiaceae bacterium]